MKRITRVFVLFGWLAISLGLSNGTPAKAADKTMDECMKELARDVCNYLAAEGQSTVVVEKFRSSASMPVQSAIQKSLQNAIAANANASLASHTDLRAWKLVGKVQIDKKAEPIAVKVRATIEDHDANEMKEFPATFSFNEVNDVVKASGVVFDNSQNESGIGHQLKLASKIQEAVTQPSASFFLDSKGRLRASKTSPFALSIVSTFAQQSGAGQPGEQSVVPINADGSMVAHAGDTFVVKMDNDADFPILVELYIDGMSAFEFTTVDGWKTTNALHFSPGQSGVFKGWYVDNQSYKKFQFAHLPEQAVLKLGKSLSQVGTIQAVVYKNIYAPKPPGPTLRGAGPSTNDHMVVIPGAVVASKTEQVQAVKDRVPLASIMLRYEKPDLPPGT